jgi:hypothetical protein
MTTIVWVVQHDQGPDNTILGVFAAEDEASRFAEDHKDEFGGSLIYAPYAVGYRYDQGPGHVAFTPTG